MKKLFSALLFGLMTAVVAGAPAAPAVEAVAAPTPTSESAAYDADIDYGTINEYGLVERDGDTLAASWKGMPANGPVTILWQEIGSGKEGFVTAQVSGGKARFANPNPARRVVYKFPAADGSLTTLAERKAFATGMDNLRDMGGYKTAEGRRTRWGLLYRGDTPFKLKADGYRYFNDMNMGYVFDLRTADEAARKPDPAFEGVTYFHTHIPDNPPGYEDVSWDTNEDIYNFVSTPRALSFYVDANRFMAEEPKSVESMKTIFDSALKADGKALFWHCAGGKDRTGFVSAVFLAALGVPRETIVNDYLLTRVYRRDYDLKELKDMTAVFKGDEAARQGFLAVQDSRREYVNAALDRLESKYGSIPYYLESAIGLTPDQLRKLKDMYTE